MQVTITAEDVGRRYTFDAAQVFRIQHIGADTIKVKDTNCSDTVPRRVGIAYLEGLFACGRAEWGFCIEEQDSIVEAGW